MKGALALRNPVVQAAAAVLDTTGTNITSAAYVTLLTKANHTKACSAIMVTNGGSQPLQLASGDAGSEVDTGIVIPPGGQGYMIPVELAKSTRLSLKSLGATQSSGIVTTTFFQ